MICDKYCDDRYSNKDVAIGDSGVYKLVRQLQKQKQDRNLDIQCLDIDESTVPVAGKVAEVNTHIDLIKLGMTDSGHNKL